MSLSDKIKELEDKYKFERLEKQLFIGKVIEEIGFEKCAQLVEAVLMENNKKTKP